MKKKEREDVTEARLDMLVQMCTEEAAGNCEPLAKELDAMHTILRVFSDGFLDRGKNRMSMIVSMLADLAAIVQMQAMIRATPPSPQSAPPAKSSPPNR